MKKVLLFSFFFIVIFADAETPMILEWGFTDTVYTKLYTRGSADYIIKDASDQIVSTGTFAEGVNYVSVPQTGAYAMEITNTSNFAFKGIDEVTYEVVFPDEMKKLLQWGDTDLNNDLTEMFAFSEIEMTAEDIPNFKHNTNLTRMFYYAINFTGDLSGWDVSNVTDMEDMFAVAKSFNSDLSGWDVSNVRDMVYMFSEAISFNSDLSGWDVSNITYMYEMFSGAASLYPSVQLHL